MIIGITGLARSGKDTAADFLVKNYGFVKVALADSMKRALMEWFDWTENQLWGEGKDVPDKRYLRRAAQNECVCTKCCQRILGEKFEEMPIGSILFDRDCLCCGKTITTLDMHFVSLPVEYLTPRHALQQLGTEFGRECYDNVWIDCTMRAARAILGEQRLYSAQHGLGVGANEYQATRVRGVVIPDVRFKNEADAIFAAGGDVWRIVRPGAGLQGETAKHASETEQTAIQCAYTMNNVLGLDNLEELVAYGLKTTFDENGVRRGERK